MHNSDEIRATVEQVRRLVAAQRPQWAGLPVTPLPGEVEGTDHVLFRIGDELVARMPKIAWAVDQADSDARWLPVLAPRLPVRIPVPLHLGEPGAGYPWRWTVVPWIAGSTPPRLGCDDVPLAREVAAFARALHGVDPAGGPVKPPGSRGSALRHADDGVRRVLPRLGGQDDGFDVTAAEAAWDACLAAPDWDRDPVWIHGDLQPGNRPGPGRLPGGDRVRRRHLAPRLRLGPGPVADRHRLLPAHLPADGRARPPHGPRSDRRTGLSACSGQAGCGEGWRGS
jgi:aminoglycoside phosphotransferase (APT) family kinase protein